MAICCMRITSSRSQAILHWQCVISKTSFRCYYLNDPSSSITQKVVVTWLICLSSIHNKLPCPLYFHLLVKNCHFICNSEYPTKQTNTQLHCLAGCVLGIRVQMYFCVWKVSVRKHYVCILPFYSFKVKS